MFGGEVSSCSRDGCVIDSLVIKISVLSRALFLSKNYISRINVTLKVIIIGPKENRIKYHGKALSATRTFITAWFEREYNSHCEHHTICNRALNNAHICPVFAVRGIHSLVCEEKSVSQSYGTRPVCKKLKLNT